MTTMSSDEQSAANAPNIESDHALVPQTTSAALPDLYGTSATRENGTDSHSDGQSRLSQPMEQPGAQPVSGCNMEGNDAGELEQGISRVSTTTDSYTIFSKSQRIMIVAITAFSGFISPFSGSIYFPALPSIASDLGITIELVNLTLTTYMIFQGLAPMFIGSISDSFGRRPAYLIAFTVYLGANIGLAVQDNYAALMVLRCFQSAGSSGTVALAYAAVADISTSSERGTYMGWASSGLMLGPTLGPIIGGALSQYLGWHAIFWFLAILALVALVLILILLPETGRNVVGNGSIPPPVWGMSLVNYIQLRRVQRGENLERVRSAQEAELKKKELARKRKVSVPNPLTVITILFEQDVGLLLIYNSIIYTAFFCVISSLPQLLNEVYGFNDLHAGLSFIPFGVGCAISSIVNGRLLDWNFRRVAKQHGLSISSKRGNDLRGFPIEKARIQIVFPLLYSGLCFYILYGWLFNPKIHFIGPLVTLFLLGLTLNGSFTVSSTFLVDLYPQSPATAVAANNLVRCLMGAGGTAAIIPMIRAMGRGWCFTFIGLLSALLSITLWTLLKYGPQWREERYARMEAAEARKSTASHAPEQARSRASCDLPIEPPVQVEKASSDGHGSEETKPRGKDDIAT